MQLIDGQPVYSATDLVGFLACEHLTQLDRAAVAGLVERPVRSDPEIDVIARRGLEHEQRYLADLEAKGRQVTRIVTDGSAADRDAELRRATAETREAILRGDDVIYQATFFDGRWRGHADFLLRVERPTPTLGWSYEVADTKLARHAKAGALLQLCVYSEQLAVIQGALPDLMHVALGGSARAVETFRVADYMAYYRQVKVRFEAALREGQAGYPPGGTYPEPVEHCDVCRWAPDCIARRRGDDHLSLVAGISRRQRNALVSRGIDTRTKLAEAPLPLLPPLETTSREAYRRVREQARIQVEGERAGRILHELLPVAHDRETGSIDTRVGLASLPEPSSGDLFFDIEGDPFAFDDGLDYLFGLIDPSQRGADGEPVFTAIWSRDDQGEFSLEGEKRAFERLVDVLMARLEADPGMHVYHYAPYEPSALKRLMGRHATREDEVDRLLRGGVLVDLHRVTRQGVRASVESYSIKRLEPLYGFRREVDLRDAGSSIVAFEAWLELGESDVESPAAGALERIERYNRDDCVSNLRLRDWLEERRAELATTLAPTALPRPAPPDPRPPGSLSEWLEAVSDMEARLTSDVPADPLQRTADQQARWLLAQLLSWHRREDKAAWWRYFHMVLEMTDEERIEASDPIGGLEYVRVVDEVRKSLVHRYRYPDQDHRISAGAVVHDPLTRSSPGKVVAVDLAARTVDLERGKTSQVPHPTSLVPYEVVRTPEQQASLMRIAAHVEQYGLTGDGRFNAARQLLLGLPPRCGQPDGSALAAPGESGLDAARRLVLELAGSTLAIQGPPGSGKTYTGARMILALVAAGKRVGVTATSHKVIANLLDAVAEAASESGQPARIGQKAEEDELAGSATRYAGNGELLAALGAGELDVAGGTSWVWARDEFEGSVDVLFVDESGQISLANTIAVSPAADSLVLLGDPQQLDQPLQGTHPPGAERSALGHLLGDQPTMPPELGLFLATTWRLHPDLCEFTSEAFYEGKLEPEAHLAGQRLRGPSLLDGTGIRFLAVPHTGNDSESVEEAEVVADLVRSLVEEGATWVDARGVERAVDQDDVLVVAPYNAQVGEIRRRLPGGRVGTVDKFQGQEAPVSIYSMTTSSPEEAPRGMDFLYSLNRLNVATSRARCVAVVVASPELVRVRCKTPRQMRLANALCRLVEMADQRGLTASSTGRR